MPDEPRDPYREPDPERAMALHEDAENRSALERLAAAGMRKKQARDAVFAARFEQQSKQYLQRLRREALIERR